MRTHRPPITAVDQAPRLAGSRCAEVLDALLAGTADPGTRVEVPLRITHRASTGGPRHGGR